MSNVAYLGRRISGFNSSSEFDGYSRVVITVSDEMEYSAGTETGRTLTLVCPWGSQQMAEDILSNIRGFQYQPYKAQYAVLDPAAELGDGLIANDTYSGIYSMTSRFGSLYRADASAPSEEELDHEYPYVPKQERKVTRKLHSLSTELKVQAGLISAEIQERKENEETINTQLTLQSGLIAAKVSSTGGDMASFGWELDETSWTIKANGADILKATRDGLEVYGKITATSGRIGGFTINESSLSYNNQTWEGSNTTGIYIGPMGIQLGKNFRVDAAGNLKAASGEFSGYVRAQNIKYGVDASTGINYGTLSGESIKLGSIFGSRLAENTIDTDHMGKGIRSVLTQAQDAYAVIAQGVQATTLGAATMYAGKLKIANELYFDEKQLYLTSIYVNGKYHNVVKWE